MALFILSLLQIPFAPDTDAPLACILPNELSSLQHITIAHPPPFLF
ncbi:MAG: hypothetical protein P8H59_03625 [Flavobacteriales bacterium]|nr:hypothetical protein [Flavobacteriales bacterium]